MDISSNQATLQAMVTKALNMPGALERLQNVPKQWNIASTCSGTGNFELAMEAVAKAVNQLSSVPEPFEAHVSAILRIDDECFVFCQPFFMQVTVTCVLSGSIQVQVQYACECERWKQVNLVQNVIGARNQTTCLFDDVTTMTDQEERKCLRHGDGKNCVSCCCFQSVI